MAIIDNLVSYWKLDESSGTIVDSHGSNDGTYNGALYSQTGKIGTSIGFDGTDDVISMPSFIKATDPLSFSGWIFMDDNTDVQEIFQDITNTSGDWTFWNISGKLRLRVFGTGTTTHETIGTITIPTGEFVYVAFSKATGLDGDVTLALNGDQETITPNTTIKGRDAGVGFGGDGFGHLDGKIDESGIWDKGLSGAEMTELYNSGSGLAFPFSTATVRLIKIAGTFVEKPILTKVAGTFVDKPIKIKVGGTFVDA